MNPKVILTGRPGCGKTTVIKRVVSKLTRPAGGFYTEEIRERGTRVGFKLVTLDGEQAVFAHVATTAVLTLHSAPMISNGRQSST